MRLHVADQSPGRLEVRLRPVSTWAYVLFGLLFIGMGCWVATVLGRALRLECAHERKACAYASTQDWRWRRSTVPLPAIRDVRVDTIRTAISASMRLVIRTDSGDVPIDLLGADGPEKLAHRDRLLRFLTDASAGPVAIAEDVRLLGWGLGLLLIIAGCVVLLSLEAVILVADRAEGVLRLSSTRWRRTRDRQVPIADIQRVEKHCYTIRHTRSCNVVLQLRNERSLRVTRTPLFTDQSADALVRLLRAELLRTRG